MDIFMAFILPALVGLAIGVLSGLLGIGGGTIMVPVFRLVFGMSPVVSTATSLFTIIPTSISGAVSHVRNKTCLPALGVAAGLGGACTSPIGVWLAQISPAWAIMLAAALIIGYSALNMLMKAAKMKPASAPATAGAARDPSTPLRSAQDDNQRAITSGETPQGSSLAVPDGASEGSPLVIPSGAPQGAESRDPVRRQQATSQQPASAKLSRRQLLIGAAIGLGAGLASGYVGVGGGFIMVPLMLSLVGISMKQASGTSLIAVMILAVPGVIEQALLGNINYAAGIAIAIGSIPGALIGARLVRFVPERTLRFIFGGFLIVAAAVLVLNELGILG